MIWNCFWGVLRADEAIAVVFHAAQLSVDQVVVGAELTIERALTVAETIGGFSLLLALLASPLPYASQDRYPFLSRKALGDAGDVLRAPVLFGRQPAYL